MKSFTCSLKKLVHLQYGGLFTCDSFYYFVYLTSSVFPFFPYFYYSFDSYCCLLLKVLLLQFGSETFCFILWVFNIDIFIGQLNYYPFPNNTIELYSYNTVCLMNTFINNMFYFLMF